MTSTDRLANLAGQLRAGDFASLRDHLADEFYASKRGPGEPSAADRITDLALDLKAALPDLTAVLDDLETHADGHVTATMTLRGTHRNELWGVPGSGDVVEWTAPLSIRAVGERFAFGIDGTSTADRVGLVRKLRLVNPPDEMDQPPRFPVVWPEFLLKLVFTGQAADRPCSHLDQIAVTEPSTSVCEQCVASGDVWPALRMCLVCGFVGCCDTSKNRHMAKHHEETGHPIFRSIRNDEGWVWCYEDDAFFERSLLDRAR
jgi:hypothetical protein